VLELNQLNNTNYVFKNLGRYNGGSHSIFSLSLQLDMLSEQQEKESILQVR
jgi:hypothetical protein